MSLLVARVAGGPRERGAAVGATFAPRIAASLEFSRSYLSRRGVRAEDLPRMLEPYRAAAAAALEQRGVWVSPGHPCRAPFEEVDLGAAA